MERKVLYWLLDWLSAVFPLSAILLLVLLGFTPRPPSLSVSAKLYFILMAAPLFSIANCSSLLFHRARICLQHKSTWVLPAFSFHNQKPGLIQCASGCLKVSRGKNSKRKKQLMLATTRLFFHRGNINLSPV